MWQPSSPFSSPLAPATHHVPSATQSHSGGFAHMLWHTSFQISANSSPLGSPMPLLCKVASPLPLSPIKAAIFYLFIKYWYLYWMQGVTLVNKMIQVSGVHFCNTASVHCIACSPLKLTRPLSPLTPFTLVCLLRPHPFLWQHHTVLSDRRLSFKDSIPTIWMK